MPIHFRINRVNCGELENSEKVKNLISYIYWSPLSAAQPSMHGLACLIRQLFVTFSATFAGLYAQCRFSRVLTTVPYAFAYRIS